MEALTKNKSIEERYEEHLSNEPKKKWKIYLAENKMGINTDEWSKWDFESRRLKTLVDLGKEKREEILKEIKSGKMLGEICKRFNLDVSLVSDILYFNIQKNSFYSINEVSI